MKDDSLPVIWRRVATLVAWIILPIWLGFIGWLLLVQIRNMLWEVAENFWGWVALVGFIGLIGLVKIGVEKFRNHRNATAWQRKRK